MGSNLAANPYRELPAGARWICIACHRSLSRLAGVCPRCGVERLDLMRPDVREEVRQHAEKMLYRRMMREELIFGGCAIGVGMVIGWALFVAYYDRLPDGRLPFAFGMMVGLIVRWVALRAYLKLRPDAAISVYAARRHRHRQTLGIDATGLQQDEDALAVPGGNPNLDPEVADLEQLLRSLGATLDA
jgi:hypothetical protein